MYLPQKLGKNKSEIPKTRHLQAAQMIHTNAGFLTCWNGTPFIDCVFWCSVVMQPCQTNSDCVYCTDNTLQEFF